MPTLSLANCNHACCHVWPCELCTRCLDETVNRCADITYAGFQGTASCPDCHTVVNGTHTVGLILSPGELRCCYYSGFFYSCGAGVTYQPGVCITNTSWDMVYFEGAYFCSFNEPPTYPSTPATHTNPFDCATPVEGTQSHFMLINPPYCDCRGATMSVVFHTPGMPARLSISFAPFVPDPEDPDPPEYGTCEDATTSFDIEWNAAEERYEGEHPNCGTIWFKCLFGFWSLYVNTFLLVEEVAPATYCPFIWNREVGELLLCCEEGDYVLVTVTE